MKKLGLIASVAIAALVTFYILTSLPFPFVKVWWHAADYDPQDRFSKRHRMADWLVMTNALVGLRRDEVVAKLGSPPPSDYFTDYNLVYRLGFERGFFP
jgi:hypothetical protein